MSRHSMDSSFFPNGVIVYGGGRVVLRLRPMYCQGSHYRSLLPGIEDYGGSARDTYSVVSRSNLVDSKE